jgi:hypothetical protein
VLLLPAEEVFTELELDFFKRGDECVATAAGGDSAVPTGA